MKVLYFHQHFSTPEGAGGTRSYEMAQRLVRAGHQVTMVCGSYEGGKTGISDGFRDGIRRGIVDGIEVLEFSLSYSNADNFIKRALTFLRYSWRSIRVALTAPYDLAFATSTPLTAGIPGIMARWIRGKKFVFEVRDLWPELPKEMGVIRNPVVLGLMSILEWTSYKSAHRLIGLSPGIVAGIRRRGIPANRITMIPNGCDLEYFAREVSAWRPSGVADDEFLAIFAGSHGIANGLDSLLDAAQELQRRNVKDIKLLLIGQGMLKPKLVARAQKEQLSNVVFHPPVSKKKLVGLMKSADLGLQLLANIPAFYYGTSPNKFFDYIAAGLPVLANYPGWIAELIEKNNCGLVVPPDDESSFADALQFAAENRSKIRMMARRAEGLAKRTFSRDVLGKRFVNWLEST